MRHDNDSRLDRRAFLAAAGAGAVGMGALAGCSLAVGSVAPPDVPQDRLSDGGWEKRDENQRTVFEQTYGAVTLTAKAHTVSYGDAELRRSVREKTLGRIDAALSVFSATHIDFSADLDTLPVASGEVMSRVESNAREQFRQRLREAGLTDVEHVDTGTTEVASGGPATLHRYDAVFPVDPFEFQVDEGHAVRLEGDRLGVAGDLAVWHAGDYALVAGGAYPAENFARTADRSLSEGIDVTIDIDLGLTPSAYRDEVRGLIGGTR